MKTQKKLIKTVMFSMVWLLLSYTSVQSQNASMIATAPVGGSQSKVELTEQDKSRLEFLQLSILKAKAELENGLKSNSLSQSQIQSMKFNISELESEVKMINSVLVQPSVQKEVLSTETKQPVTAQQVSQTRNADELPSVVAYKSFVPTSSNSIINDLQLNVLKLKAYIDLGKISGNLTASEIEAMQNDIVSSESKIQMLQEEEMKMQQENSK